MSTLKKRPHDERTAQAHRLFEREIRQALPADTPPRAFVAIDVETGDYEVDENDVEAMDRLAERTPEAEGRMFLRRVGSKSAYHFGGRFRLEDEEEEEL